jgi:hypothetical protein
VSTRTDNRRRLGHLKRRSCTGKWRHTEAGARAYAARAADRGVVLNAYACQFCRAWHVGRDNGKGR